MAVRAVAVLALLGACAAHRCAIVDCTGWDQSFNSHVNARYIAPDTSLEPPWIYAHEDGGSTHRLFKFSQ